jgi:ribonuclease D
LLAQVRDKVAARATELDLPPALLCPRRLLEAWVRGEQSPELAGWRGQALGDLLDR